MRLKKAMFTEWHDMWWVARREWGLNVRAELHDRYHQIIRDSYRFPKWADEWEIS